MKCEAVSPVSVYDSYITFAIVIEISKKLGYFNVTVKFKLRCRYILTLDFFRTVALCFISHL